MVIYTTVLVIVWILPYTAEPNLSFSSQGLAALSCEHFPPFLNSATMFAVIKRQPELL